MQTETYDVIVLGSGGGLKLAMPAAAAGMKTALIERGPMGGTCLNRGCIPSKMMIYPADLIRSVERAGRVDLTIPPPQVNFAALMERIARETGAISAGLAQKLEQQEGLDVYREQAKFTGNRTVQVGDKLLTAPNIVIAVGAVPKVLLIPGLEGTPYLDSTSALKQTTLPKSMLVIGAGYIACELGHAYASFGTDVSFLIRSRILRKEDDEIQQVFRDAFARHHELLESYIPRQVEYVDGMFRTLIEHTERDESRWVETEALLMAVGVDPATAGLGLETTDIELDEDGFIQVNSCLQTAVLGVYAMGDCVGNYQFRHSVNMEGEYLVPRIVEQKKRRSIKYGPMPHAVFTDPEIAGAGTTEQELQKSGSEYVAGRALFSECNMGMARGLTEGLCKLMIDRNTRSILGVQIVGEEASTLVQSVVQVMYMNGSLDDLLNAVYIHPAFPEVVRDAARDAERQLT